MGTMMRLSFLPLLLIMSLGIFGALGFLNFGLVDHHGGERPCPIAVLGGGACPPVEDTLAQVRHHVSGFQLLTRFLVSPDPVFTAYFALLLAASFLAFGSMPVGIIFLEPPAFFQRHYAVPRSTTLTAKLLRWFRLHEKRDPNASLWVRGVVREGS